MNARRTLGALALAALVPSLPFLIVGELPGERWLSARDAHAVPFGAMGALLLASDLVLPIPSSVIGIMLGARLGWAGGALCTALGLVTGHSLGYWLGRFAPERWVIGAPIAPSLVGVLLTRPVPVLAEAVVLTAGAARLPWWPFLGTVLVGDALYAGALAAMGAALLPDGWHWAALLSTALMALGLWWLARRWSR